VAIWIAVKLQNQNEKARAAINRRSAFYSFGAILLRDKNVTVHEQPRGSRKGCFG
jgi:hypothetical protein